MDPQLLALLSQFFGSMGSGTSSGLNSLASMFGLPGAATPGAGAGGGPPQWHAIDRFGGGPPGSRIGGIIDDGHHVIDPQPGGGGPGHARVPPVDIQPPGPSVIPPYRGPTGMQAFQGGDWGSKQPSYTVPGRGWNSMTGATGGWTPGGSPSTDPHLLPPAPKMT